MNTKQHQLYRQWYKELDFYQEELDVFQKELNLISEKHPDLFSIIEHVDEYQRIFLRKKKRIQSLRKHIQVNDTVFANREKEGWNFNQVEEERNDFVKKMESLKKNFRRFVAKNMH